jgi:hypothetical protein
MVGAAASIIYDASAKPASRGGAVSHPEDSAVAAVKHEDKLGKIAMRIIAVSILLAIVVSLVADGIDAFPYGIYGFVGAIVLCVVSFAVGQVE